MAVAARLASAASAPAEACRSQLRSGNNNSGWRLGLAARVTLRGACRSQGSALIRLTSKGGSRRFVGAWEKNSRSRRRKRTLFRRRRAPRTRHRWRNQPGGRSNQGQKNVLQSKKSRSSRDHARLVGCCCPPARRPRYRAGPTNERWRERGEGVSLPDLRVCSSTSQMSRRPSVPAQQAGRHSCLPLRRQRHSCLPRRSQRADPSCPTCC